LKKRANYLHENKKKTADGWHRPCIEGERAARRVFSTKLERTMPQTLYHASGLTADNADKLKDAGMNVPGVKWVNINNGNIVVTHDDSFDADAFAAALHGTDGSVSLSR